MAFVDSVPVLGDVYKCVDRLGHAAYQETPCPITSRNEVIDRRYSSVLPLGLSDEVLRAFLDADSRRAKARTERNRRLDAVLGKIAAKQRQCRSLKARYLRLQARSRQHANPDRFIPV